MRPPQIPQLLGRKIYKTGQTRGADDDQIFQNRVGRSSTVLIPFSVYLEFDSIREMSFENGFIVLIRPKEYFNTWNDSELEKVGLTLGRDTLIFYEMREEWNLWNPDKLGLKEPTSRTGPLGGHYVARIANTTAAGDQRINVGYTSTGLKGAGIRLYEYASNETTTHCRVQLESIFWCAADATDAMIAEGMSKSDISQRVKIVQEKAQSLGLLDFDILEKNRVLNANRELICPLCRDRISAKGFVNRLAQASGRERHDLTVTEVNLFHIKELSYGVYNHRPYNLGWGHHHCNVVCKDAGIDETLNWLKAVLDRNVDYMPQEAAGLISESGGSLFTE